MSYRCPHGKLIDSISECSLCLYEDNKIVYETEAAIEQAKQTRLLEEIARIQNAERMFCPKCRRIIIPPSDNEISKYAKFYRDNKCYYCDSLLIKR